MKKTLFLFLTCLFFFRTFGQVSNGKVNSLVAAENYFSGMAGRKGIKKAFLQVSDENTLIFRPGPVNAQKYFKDQAPDNGQLSWEPVWAKISKSGDWGFTTGPYIYRSAENPEQAYYGEYVSVWKMNSKGIWKLAIDIGMSHPKPLAQPKLLFVDPTSSRYYLPRSKARLQQREDVILTSDKLLSAVLEQYKVNAYHAFFTDEARLLFPGFEPLIGKEKITNFLQAQQFQISTEPLAANRAHGSDLAYTYGTASITQKGITKPYHYVRIWEIQDNADWNVILEIFSPAKSN
ncbi:MAG TPA: hypothetical protein VEV16_04930 [Daejeonella sp.]|nr:hypothetical protein [Daejeonella sp.]